MSSGKKDYAAGEWLKTAGGRLYRYIDIEGHQYCQWDHAKGPVLPVDSSIPRTTNPRNPAGTPPSSTQRPAPHSTSETRPIPVRNDSLNVSGANALPYGQARPPELTAYGSYPYGSYPPENHQPVYSLFPRDDRQQPSISRSSAGVNQQYTNTTLSGREDKAYDEPDRSLSNLPKVQTKTDKPKYPVGTRKIINKPGRTYYLDGDGNVISTVAVTPKESRQETRADHESPATEDLSARFASMGSQGRSLEGVEQSWTSKHSIEQVYSTQSTAGDNRASSRHRSDTRDSPQVAGRDAKTASTRPDLVRHYSQGSSVSAQDERGQSRERVIVRQRRGADDNDNDDGEPSGQPLQRPLRESPEQQPTHKESIKQSQGPSQRTVSDDILVQRSQTTSNARRLSVNQGSGLPTISESGLLKTTWIAGDKNGRSEAMDDRYFVRKDAKTFFVTGRVFAMLWHENAGNEGTDLSEGRYYNGKWGQRIYSTIRRMVVVGQRHGHCTCVPIATYGRQGTLKSGLSEADIKAHAVIYMVDTSSEAAPGERIVKNPIAVKPAKDDQKLHSMSRINFDKIYTIEHNVKVMNVGKVAEGSLHNLSLYFRNTHFPT